MGNQPHQPLVYAHRGASAYAPENTLAAFELAIQHKADLIELDAKLTADQQVVVIHDRTVDRTTNGAGRVSELTLSEIRKLNAGNKFQDHYPHEKIPTLEEVIELCKGRICLNIELSNYAHPLDRLPYETANKIKHYQLQDQIIISSFHPIPLWRFQRLEPGVLIGFLARSGYSGFLSRSWLGRALVHYNALHPEKSDVNPALINHARKSGHKVVPFTVNDPEEMKKLIALGVDGLITDDPQLAREVISSNREP
jgi:glycerophosphoryl diester phosphodiesterase